jgi:ribosomal protein S18 acetylase RimI-like enzyme
MLIEKLESAGPDVFRQVAEIHEARLDAGLLARLGTEFLSRFYEYVATDPGSVLFVARSDGRVDAFLSATEDTHRLYRRFLVRRLASLIPLLVPRLLDPRNLLRAASLRRYLAAKPLASLPPAELLSMAVREGAQQKGIGRELVASLRSEFRRRGISRFRVTAAETQHAALRFYPAVGGELVGTTELGPLRSSIFVCSTAAFDSPGASSSS